MSGTTPAPLRAAVIAAGRGERLRSAAPLKPLVEVGGRTLIERVLQSLAEAGASDAVVIINEESTRVRDELTTRPQALPVRWIVRTTPSSMHSFLAVTEALAADSDGPFLISTVDTVAAPGTFARFVRETTAGPRADVTLALTPFVDDEKPLRVSIDGTRVTAIGTAAAQSPMVTAGFYLVRPTILAEAEAARRDGLTALRQYLERLLDRGYAVAGVPVATAVDVDREPDIGAAEAFLRSVRA